MAKDDGAEEVPAYLGPEIYHAQDPLTRRRLRLRRDPPDLRRDAPGLDLFDPFAPPGNFLAFFARGNVYVMQEFAIVDGAMELVRVDIRGYARTDSETTGVVRHDDLRMPLVGMRDAALSKHREAAETIERDSRDDVPEADIAAQKHPGFAAQIHDFAADHAEAASARGRKRPPPIPDALVRQVVAMYREIRSSTRHPEVRKSNVEIARRMDLDLDKVNRIVRKARWLGYLPRSTHGVPKI